jgi:hypothetical protein
MMAFPLVLHNGPRTVFLYKNPVASDIGLFVRDKVSGFLLEALEESMEYSRSSIPFSGGTTGLQVYLSTSSHLLICNKRLAARKEMF